MRKNGFSIIILPVIAVVILFVGLTGYYFLSPSFKKNPQSAISGQVVPNLTKTEAKSPVSSTSSAIKQNLKTYSFPAGRFSFKYPSELLMKEVETNYGVDLDFSDQDPNNNFKIYVYELDLTKKEQLSNDFLDLYKLSSGQEFVFNNELFNLKKVKKLHNYNFINPDNLIFGFDYLTESTSQTAIMMQADTYIINLETSESNRKIIEQIAHELSYQNYELTLESFARPRDSSRLTDLANLQQAINVATFESIDSDNSNFFCSNSSVGNEACFGSSISSSTLSNGKGWVKVDLTKQKAIAVDKLPVDVSNDSKYHYAYCATKDGWELNATLESKAESPKMKSDGGDNDLRYEVGSNLNLMDKVAGCSY